MNHTLTHGLDLLMYLACSPQSHGVTELARTLGLPKSHIHRLLQTLVESHYVEQDDQRRYKIGVGALRLGQALLSQLPLRQSAMPIMIELARKHQLSVTLAMPFGNQAIAVAHVTHDGKIRPHSESLGSTLSAHASASGKLFLAHRPAKERDDALKCIDYPQNGPNTHTSATSLRKNLTQIKQQGYSLNEQENSPNTISMASAVHDAQGQIIACLGFAGSTKEIPEARIPPLIQSLQAAVQDIEQSHKEHRP